MTEDIGGAEGAPPPPEQEVDWDRFLGMIESVAIGRGYQGRNQSIRWRNLAKDMKLKPNAINRYLKRTPAPDWVTCARLAEFSGIDLEDWLVAAGLLPPHLTRVRSDRDNIQAGLDAVRAMYAKVGDEKAWRAIRSAGLLVGADELPPTPPSRLPRPGREAGQRPPGNS